MNEQFTRILAVSEGEKLAYDAAETWLDLFLREVKKHPNQTAVEDESGSFSYRELHEASDRVAGYLMRKGLRENEFVAVKMHREKEFLAVVLGIHKAGGAYVPIDLDYPTERIAYMLDDCEARLVMTDVTAAAALKTEAAFFPEGYRCKPDTLAYMIYTSGSTGKPKGVMIQHKALLNFIHFIRSRWHLTADSRIGCHSNFAFDASVEDLFPVLTVGGTLVIVPEEVRKDIFDMQKFLRDRRVTGGCYSTRFGQILAMDKALNVDYICLGGEAMTGVPNVTGAVYNTYGPTEFTVDATYYEIEKDRDYHPIPIGRPLYNCAAFILDENLELLPLGEIGELCLAGPQLALGYWKRPELTQEKFVDVRIAEGDVRKVYRTGDLARYNAEGQLEFCGRIDSQVKLRGFRIELGEVETAALKFAGIRQAAAEVRKDTLCLYYTAEETIDEEELKRFLGETLTDYMIPGWFGRLEKMPETPNGKLDRKALPEPSLKRTNDFVAPRTDAEKAVALCMKKALGAQEELGAADDFLDMGGDSIKAIRFVCFLREHNLSLKVADVLKFRTVEAIAACCRQVAAEANKTAEPIEGLIGDSAIFLFYKHLTYPNPAYFNQSTLLEWKGSIDLPALQKALDALCWQHDLLRARFQDGHLYVKKADAAVHAVTIEQYALEKDDKGEIADCCENIQSALDVENSLVRAAVLRLPGRALFFITAHHTIVDGISWRILLDDLETAYGQAVNGETIALPAKTETYQDYVRAMQAYRDSYELSLEIPYWKKVEKKMLSLETSLGRDYTRRFDRLTVRMNETETNGLLSARLSAYGLEINDLLLTAVAQSYRNVFGRNAVSVQMEGHGREPLGKELLTGRTVGWFTSIYPVVFEDITGDARHDLIRVKETLHRVPNKGVGYNILAFVEGKQPLCFEKDRTPKIVFNYLGNVSGEGREQQYFVPDSRDGFAAGLDYQAKENCDGADLTINCLIDGGQFGLWLDYNADQYDEKTANAFADGILKEIHRLAAHLETRNTKEITASDLGEPAWSEEEFDAVVAGFSSRGETLKRIYPLTPLQEGMLLSHVSAPASSAYRLVDIYALSYVPTEKELRLALDALGRKHEVLRTAILHKGVSVPRQAITDRQLGLTMTDISGEKDPLAAAYGIREDLLANGFDLQDKPLFRLVCARTGENSCFLITAVHHIVMDGWCVDTYLKDLEEFLRMAKDQGTDKPIEVGTTDEGKFEQAVRELLLKDRNAAVNCFKTLLDGYEGKAEIPAHTPIPERERSETNVIFCTVSPKAAECFDNTCRNFGVTLAEGITTAWGLTLATACRMDDVVFNRVVSGRDKNSFDVTDLVGPFINSVPTRLRIGKDSTGRTLLQEIHNQCAQTGEYDFCPLADLKKAMNTTDDLAYSLISIENYMADDQAGSFMKPVLVKEEPIGGITVDVMTQADGGALISLSYSPERYRKAEAERVLKLLEQYMRMLTEHPEKPVRSLPLLNPADEEAVIALSQGEKMDYDTSVTWVDLFKAQAKQRPDQTAVVDADSEMTYRELDEASDKIAAYIRSKEIKENEFAAVRMGRVKEFHAVVLGAHKAGVAYVPIDLDYPADRVEYMLSDSGARLVFTEALVHEILSGPAPAAPGRNDAAPEKAAYMIYTSGSTGRPKGVVIQHKALLCFVRFVSHRWQLTENSRISVHPNFSFDASVENLYPALTVGGTVIIAPEEARRDIVEMRRFIAKHRINGGSYSTQFGQLLAKDEPLDVNYLDMGGEAMTITPKARGHVFNVYGPTEFTVIATYFELEKGKQYNPIPIGRPLYNCAGYIVDAAGRLLPQGMTGELCLAGPQMALGYLNRPELTAEKFARITLRGKDRVKVYHTGDLARYNEEGQLEYCGRIDFQVKLRGFRIELGEVENRAAGFPRIVHAVAAVKKNTLCLYYQASASVDEKALKAFMAETLTDYMIPGCFIRVERMPMTASGKINRALLPEPDFAERKTAYEAPRNETERRLCEAMEKVLDLDANTVGIQDDFFEIGGDSLKSMMLMTSAGVDGLSAKMIFTHRTAQRIAEAVASLRQEDMEHFEDEARTMSIPAHKGQIMMIDDQFADVYSCMCNLASLYKIGAKVDAERLAAAVDKAVQQHPALCSTFVFDEDGNIRLQIVPGFPGKTEVKDISPEEVGTLSTALKKPFTLFRQPLFRAKVLRCGEDVYLFTDMHHTVSDGFSIGILLRDIAKAYRGEELTRDYFYSYLRKEYEARETEEFKRAWEYFNNLLGGRDWCRIPTPDFETFEPESAVEDLEDVLSTDQMKAAEIRTGYSRSVMAIAAVILALQEYCGRDEINVDYLNSNRTETYLQSSVGLVFKTLPVAIDLKRYEDLEHVMAAINGQVIDSFANSICDYRAEVEDFDLDCIAVNYVADLGSEENMEGFDAEALPLEEDGAMGGHADIYFTESDGMISIELEYMKQGYKQENMRTFIRLCGKYLNQIAGR